MCTCAHGCHEAESYALFSHLELSGARVDTAEPVPEISRYHMPPVLLEKMLLLLGLALYKLARIQAMNDEPKFTCSDMEPPASMRIKWGSCKMQIPIYVGLGREQDIWNFLKLSRCSR